MHHLQRIGAASLLVVLLAGALATPMATPSHASAAGSCGTYRSETVPPATIRVFRTATGAVETVDFRTYVKNVLSREWISTWTTESLRSGALAVKNYGWYQVLHWRGYVNEDGKCFDVFDSTRDQHYDPSRPTYASMASAVDATWSTLAQVNGRIFATYYNAGAPSEPCGANANGWQMFQWGTQACGLAGKTAAQILVTYYAGVVVTAAPPPSTATAIADTDPNATAHAGTDGDARPVAGIDARRNAGSDAHGDARPDPRTAADPGTAGTAGARWRPGRAGEATSPAPVEPGADRRHRGRRQRIGHGVPDHPAPDEAHARASAARHRHPRPGAEPVATGDGADRHWQALGRRVPGALPRWPARPVVSRPGRGAGW